MTIPPKLFENSGAPKPNVVVATFVVVPLGHGIVSRLELPPPLDNQVFGEVYSSWSERPQNKT